MNRSIRKTLTSFLLPLASSGLLFSNQASASSQEELEKENLKKAVYCMKVLEVEFDLEKAERECFADVYIQHSAHVPDGKEGVLKYFAERIKKYPNAHMEIKRAGADDDLVWIHLHFQRSLDVRGNAIIHIFRMEDGKFAEHWGVGMPVPETSVHGNSVF